MKYIAAFSMAILIAAANVAVAEVKTSAVNIGGNVPTLPGSVAERKKELLADYEKTAQTVQEGQAHLLRLEGAIRILEIMDSETSATDTQTTGPQK